MKKRKESGTRLKDRYPKTMRVIAWSGIGLTAHALGKKVFCGDLLSLTESQPEASTVSPEDIITNIEAEAGLNLEAIRQTRTELINAHLEDIDKQLETLDPDSEDYKKLSEDKANLLELAEL